MQCTYNYALRTVPKTLDNLCCGLSKFLTRKNEFFN